MKLFNILILYVIFSANQNVQAQYKPFPKILSNVNAINKLKWAEKLSNDERKIKYIGKYRDTLLLSEREFDLEDYKVSVNEARYLYSYPNYGDNKLAIKFDTTQLVGSRETLWVGNVEKIKIYDAIPVIIENKSDSTIIVGFGRRIPIFLEALDIDDKWKPIEKPYIYKSGTGLRKIMLKSNDIVCVLVPKYSGDFITQLRLRLGQNISVPFCGRINRNQFRDNK